MQKNIDQMVTECVFFTEIIIDSKRQRSKRLLIVLHGEPLPAEFGDILDDRISKKQVVIINLGRGMEDMRIERETNKKNED